MKTARLISIVAGLWFVGVVVASPGSAAPVSFVALDDDRDVLGAISSEQPAPDPNATEADEAGEEQSDRPRAEREQNRPHPPRVADRMGWRNRFGPRDRDADGAPGRATAPILRRLMPLIAERNPELARRLRRLWQTSPERFERIVADAMILRLEAALDEQEGVDSEAGDAALRRPLRDRLREQLSKETEGMIDEMRSLQGRESDLRQRTAQFAQDYRTHKRRGEPGDAEKAEELRRRLSETIAEHFEVRTELRRLELRRVEMEMEHLEKTLRRVRHDLERREDARKLIIDRRLRSLIGEDDHGW